MGLPRCRSTTGCTSSASNREDFILLLARRERIVNPMAGCEKVLYAIRPAMAERLNGILKYAYFLSTHFKTKREARKAVEEAIRIYNTRRLHEKCGYKTPSAFREEAMRKAA